MSYHDYVIKDGKFIGRFEEMYKECPDPWRQQDSANHALSKSRNIAILNMKSYGIRSVLEVGSGLGYFASMIHGAGIKVVGMDVSETAIQKARQIFPEVEFVVGKVTELEKFTGFDAILFADVTWYILPELKEAYRQMLAVHRGKYFLHNLVFYKPGQQKYGREYFTNFQEFAAHCPFQLLESTISESSDPESTIATSAIFRIES